MTLLVIYLLCDEKRQSLRCATVRRRRLPPPRPPRPHAPAGGAPLLTPGTQPDLALPPRRPLRHHRRRPAWVPARWPPPRLGHRPWRAQQVPRRRLGDRLRPWRPHHPPAPPRDGSRARRALLPRRPRRPGVRQGQAPRVRLRRVRPEGRRSRRLLLRPVLELDAQAAP